MIKPVLNPTVIIRTPRFPYDIELFQCWAELKELIREASPDFYAKVANLSYGELKVAEPKVQQTVNKYFNRARYRATPFGSFASLTAAAIKPDKTIIQIEDNIQQHIFTHWKYRNNETGLTHKECKKGLLMFYSNTTFYKVGNELRFLRKVESTFEIATIDFDQEIEHILVCCRTPQTFSKINDTLNYYTEKELLILLRSMVDAGLLITSKHSNIIGEDYLQRVMPKNSHIANKYVISERKVKDGSIPGSVFRHLPELALKMQQLNSGYRNEMLDNFVERFNAKFEGLQVPLLITLDPEIGIGYGNLAQRTASGIMEGFNNKIEDAKPVIPSIYEAMIMDHLTDPMKRESPLNLERISNDTKKLFPLPNTIGVLCTEVDGSIFLDSMGGITANSLLGRFAFAVPEIEQLCSSLAEIEQEANPDVLFFDVGYSHEDDVDNINRRPYIYPTELSILNYSLSSNPLAVNNILVSVRNGLVILHDVSTGKRIAPRFASAYNYKRSDLPLFRFLMDIQDQGLCKNLLWRPDAFIPNLCFYPRVEFKNIIVSPAMWQLKADIFHNSPSSVNEIEILRNYLENIKDVRYFKAGIGDQTLFIDKKNDAGLGLLHSLLKKSKSIYIEEAALPKKPNAINEHGCPFLMQLNVTMQHSNEILPGFKFENSADGNLSARQWLAPGGDWLYFEIFGDPYRLESILENKVFNFLKENRQIIEKWFFIRYNEGGEHIRLRIKLKQRDAGYNLMESFNKLIDYEITIGLIADVQIKTYKREIHRYSSRLMDRIEKHFMADSRFVIQLLKFNLTELQKCNICLATLHSLRAELGSMGLEFEQTTARMSEAFNNEFNIQHLDFKEVNKLYKSLQNKTAPTFTRTQQVSYNKFLKSFTQVLHSANSEERNKLLVDLLHMHVNRAFSTNQRFMEMLIYNFFKLDLTIEKKRQSIPLFSELRA